MYWVQFVRKWRFDPEEIKDDTVFVPVHESKNVRATFAQPVVMHAP